MTDKELLELAAKVYWNDEIDDVCSIRWLSQEQCIGYTHRDNQGHNGQDREFWWNPLTDDGDAFRLAVKMKEFEPYKRKGLNVFFTASAERIRCAIVRAAAELGKDML